MHEYDQQGPWTHHDLLAWRLSLDLAESVYLLTKNFPAEEKFGLITQMRRAAVSVPSNIAEGAARNSHREFLQYVGIARGSLAELQTQLLLAERLEYTTGDSKLSELVKRLFHLINGLHSQLKQKIRER